MVGQQWALIEELDRTCTRLAETAVAEDRQRMARDLHDLVGHSFSVVLLHLSGARLNLASSPAEAEEVDRLVARYREAGMRIDLDVARDLDDVSTAPCLVLHGVLRETLTNVAKHAPAPEAAIRIDGDLETITVRIENTLGPATPHADAGLGLAGLEHRVAAIDGTFLAGPDRDHWAVEARLPRRLVGSAA
ncbi:sensor histidine kinase [Promicromonospora sp. CA-289599]|uniref:sensor histidine kinase n=1 Tax=Promicromonospora sp. CA-289599 TaxID=3240014 RepID=UPI003D916B1A